jgi:Spy/CpxP family protein refolding chaperone
MNRRIVMAAVLALSVGAISLLAQGPGQGPGGPGRGPGRGGPGRPGGPGGPGVLAMVRQLDLTDAQREQLRALAEEGRQGGDPGAPMRAAEQKLHAAVLADTPDLQAIESLKATLNSAHAAELENRVAMMQKVAQILTPAQRQQLLQLEAQGPAHGRGPGRH